MSELEKPKNPKILETPIIKTHHEIGSELKLLMFHEWSPGQAYLLPHGQRIYNKMIDLMRDEYYERDFLEVSTPTIYATELFEVSGHVCHYKQNMFFLNDSHAHSDEEVVVDNKEADSINQDQIELPTDPTAIESITEPIAESKKN
jgi:threonyl-tRNA synthetase